MKKCNGQNQKGFTLIETILYLALYGIIIGGILISVYLILESSRENDMKAMVEQEGAYILSKVDWALAGATSASVEPSGQKLSVLRENISENENPLLFDASSDSIYISRGSRTAQALNNTNTASSDAVFIHALDSGNGILPESISFSFTLTARSSRGSPYSQNFSTIRYLRK